MRITTPIQFGTVHLMSGETHRRLQAIAPPSLIDITDYDAPDFDENNFGSYKLINGGVIYPTEAVTVAVGDDSFNPAYHRNHEIESGQYKDMVCFFDGEEEERLAERTRDIAGSAVQLGYTEETFDEYWAMRTERLDRECTQLIIEADAEGKLNQVDTPTAVERVEAYITGLMTGAVERLSMYRDA